MWEAVIILQPMAIVPFRAYRLLVVLGRFPRNGPSTIRMVMCICFYLWYMEVVVTPAVSLKMNVYLLVAFQL